MPRIAATTRDIICSATSNADTDFKRFVRKEIARFEKEAEHYKILAELNSLYKVAPHSEVGLSTRDNFKAIYSEELSSAGGAARSHYDLIRASAPYGLCPYCGVGYVDQVDHFLPKSKFHEFALTSVNLVPICSRCNKNKGAKFAKRGCDQYIHPYFDLVEGIWLNCKIVFAPEVKVRFVISAEDVGEAMANRLERHFDDLKIGELYAAYSSSYLSVMRQQFLDLLDKRGVNALKFDVSEQLKQAERESSTGNDWKVALLRCLVSLPEFLERDNIKAIPSPENYPAWRCTAPS
ncbi:HNH endonuclease [Cereibacter azotoformans]|uniref:HNH endonuclease n=1 Tax=Cereibacter azotoformans TaxID=43057 RepID=UPI0015E6E547|nr:HNH endonuclease [Cereibacter azotoformans]MBO4170434.1 HNH endonuclease [Cereibacter azotoformans]